MSKIRYLSDGTHCFIGLPQLPFSYLKWCPACRSFSGSRFIRVRYVGDRRIFRFVCPACGFYEVTVTSNQAVIRENPSASTVKNLSLPPEPDWKLPSAASSSREIAVPGFTGRVRVWGDPLKLKR